MWSPGGYLDTERSRRRIHWEAANVREEVVGGLRWGKSEGWDTGAEEEHCIWDAHKETSASDFIYWFPEWFYGQQDLRRKGM